jgi:pantothenate kinase
MSDSITVTKTCLTVNNAQDGFHHTKATLSKMRSQECPFQRRGAPFTFNAESFLNLVQALRHTTVTELDEPEQAFWVPSFDHAIKDPVERDIRIASSQRIVLLEGNYVLLDEHPWSMIQELVDET